MEVSEQTSHLSNTVVVFVTATESELGALTSKETKPHFIDTRTTNRHDSI